MPQQGGSSAGLGHMELGRWGQQISLGKMVSVGSVGEGLSTETMAAVPLALSPKPYNSISPWITPVCSEQSSFHWMSTWEWNFVFWPCKRDPGFLADSLLIFISRCYWAPLPGSVHWAGEPSLGLRPLAPQGRSLQLRYSSRFLTAMCGCRASPFLISALPTICNVTSSLCPSYKTSVH